MKNSFIKTLLLFVIFYITSSLHVFAEAPTDDQLIELEKQIEQQEIEQKKESQREAEEKRRKAEEQKLKQERALLEEERRKLEDLKKKQEQERLNAEQEKSQKENAQQNEFANVMEIADSALKNRDRETAIIHFEKALAIYPENASAKQGLTAAQKLKSKICYDVLGEWSWDNGAATLILNEDGTLKYSYWGNHSGHWQCNNPALRQIHIEITALGITQTWDPVLSQDNTCLGMKLALVGPECLYRPNANKSSGDNKADHGDTNPDYGL